MTAKKDPELADALAAAREDDDIDKALEDVGTPRFTTPLDDIPDRLLNLPRMSNQEIGEFMTHACAANGEALRRVARQKATVADLREQLTYRAAEIRAAQRAATGRATDDDVILDPVHRKLREKHIVQARVLDSLIAAQQGMESTLKTTSRQITVRLGEGTANRLEDGVSNRGRKRGTR